jgi:hypothetical protein
LGAIGRLLESCLPLRLQCVDPPGSFQTSCDHLAAANDAVADGDIARAKHELTDAYDWGEPAYEDAAGTYYAAAVDDSYLIVGITVYQFGAQHGRQALVDAERVCS